jgi:hypothetical protein
MSARSNNATSISRDERATTTTEARSRRMIFAQSFGMVCEPKDAPFILVNGCASFKHNLAEAQPVLIPDQDDRTPLT